MCEALEKLVQKGVEQGIAQGIEQIIVNGLKKGKTCDEIAEFNDLPLEQVRAVEEKINQKQ